MCRDVKTQITLQAGSFEMAPAPTEEGDALANVDEALADLEEAGEQGPRRHSRSFSEPNLVAHALQQQAYQQAKPLEASRHQESSEEDEESLAANRVRPVFRSNVFFLSSCKGLHITSCKAHQSMLSRAFNC